MEKQKEKAKGLLHEFKVFISRGNVIDLAVGVIIGSAFTAIVNSLVNDIEMCIRDRCTTLRSVDWGYVFQKRELVFCPECGQSRENRRQHQH